MNKNKIVCGIAVFAAVGLALLLPDVVAKGKSSGSSGSSKHEDSNSDSDKKKHDNKQNAGEGANHAAALQINSKQGADKVVASLKTLNAKDYRVQVYQNGKIVKTYGALPLSDVQMISKTANISTPTAAQRRGGRRGRGGRGGRDSDDHDNDHHDNDHHDNDRHDNDHDSRVTSSGGDSSGEGQTVIVTTRARATLEKMQTALQGVDKKAYDLKSVEMPEKN
jgi:hypothetical protein